MGYKAEIGDLILPNSPNLKRVDLWGKIGTANLSQATYLDSITMQADTRITNLILPCSKERLIAPYRDKIENLELVEG
jgi:hypothetical protein